MSLMISELDIVVLRKDLPDAGLQAGDVGTVVMSYDDGKAFEVEFATLTGRTISVLTLEAGAVRSVEPTDVSHVRATAP